MYELVVFPLIRLESQPNQVSSSLMMILFKSPKSIIIH